ncbi:hypothetical protein KQI18_07080 [Clostridioides mangenotii]|uniref:hypothetical protein n=1 Tax=Metaclostridioides mangenotii TaxID=1540 RepID=UPI001C11F165|nr:hypothetical protein [Clostridioides mangenotii]MBU5307547.1 hypothetical protein [Clostridioides mangenotii]
MGARYDLNFDNSKKLEEALKKSVVNLEPKINEYLHIKGSKQVMQAIIGFMPVSNRNKKHAKTSNPLKIQALNLGFEVYAKGGAANKSGSFGYLVFPDEGRGTSNLIAQRFFEEGLKSKEDLLFKDIMKIIEEQLKIQM